MINPDFITWHSPVNHTPWPPELLLLVQISFSFPPKCCWISQLVYIFSVVSTVVFNHRGRREQTVNHSSPQCALNHLCLSSTQHRSRSCTWSCNSFSLETSLLLPCSASSLEMLLLHKTTHCAGNTQTLLHTWKYKCLYWRRRTKAWAISGSKCAAKPETKSKFSWVFSKGKSGITLLN